MFFCLFCFVKTGFFFFTLWSKRNTFNSRSFAASSVTAFERAKKYCECGYIIIYMYMCMYKKPKKHLPVEDIDKMGALEETEDIVELFYASVSF